MIVIDASALMEVLLATGAGASVRARLSRDEETLHAPHLLDLEIVHVLRRGCLIGQLRPDRAAEALADLSDLRMVRHPTRSGTSSWWCREERNPESYRTDGVVAPQYRFNSATVSPAPWHSVFRAVFKSRLS